MRKVVSTCAFVSALLLATTAARAQIIPPYHRPGAQGEPRRSSTSGGSFYSTFGPAQGRYRGGAVQSGPSFPSYWTYNRFSNVGFGGLNFFYGPLGGYTPYVVPNGYVTYGYPFFGPYYSYIPLAPVVRQARPYWMDASPWDEPAAQGEPVPRRVRDPEPAAAPAPAPQPAATSRPAAPVVRVKPAAPKQPAQPDVPIVARKNVSPELLRRSMHYQVQGDDWFSKQDYVQAYARYKQALGIAPGRVEPRFRMAMALTATGNYGAAIDEMKRAMRADPDWPRNGPLLDELFGAENNLAKNAVVHKVAAWVKEDIRDSDRLFLIGVLLHFNDETDKSAAFLEACAALAPNPTYALAFLDAQADQRSHRRPEEPVPAPPEESPDDELAPAPAPAGKSSQGPTPRPVGQLRFESGRVAGAKGTTSQTPITWASSPRPHQHGVPA